MNLILRNPNKLCKFSNYYFYRKVNYLNYLCDRKELFKTNKQRLFDSNTKKYRTNILNRIYKVKNENKKQKLINIINNLDIDHIHELQLNGDYKYTNLSLIDKKINRSIGKQINHQIKNLSNGIYINKINID